MITSIILDGGRCGPFPLSHLNIPEDERRNMQISILKESRGEDIVAYAFGLVSMWRS